MFSWIKSLFSPETVSQGVSAVVNTGDALWHTDEEKAHGRERLLKLYEPFKLAQRLLAVIFCVPYGLAWFITFAMSFWINVDDQMTMLKGDMAVLVGVILAFYFGGGAFEGFITAKGGRKQ
ncbi:hypothetical protein HMF8227_01462 [Saliniradius amylolyticus]|uniref:Uncharacterized protein n=1 Tax=Saliniradius amylolyticus TaxID=2183582 RepID=A0A2S2E4L2_9ALTE|nr:hypothetical protein [Saliniradius amylolyticus]AWL11937.1 hypothetical protein HMF8227_01462 [Saliniradius amylolyticus]